MLGLIFHSKNFKLKREALKLEKERKYIEAIDKYIEALNIEPQDKEIYFRLGALYEGFDKPSQAIEMYINALNLDPNYTEPMQSIKMLIKKFPSLEISADFLEKLFIKIYTIKQRKLLLSLLANIYDSQGNLDKSREYWELLLGLSPGNLEALYGMAYIYKNKDNINLEDYQKILIKILNKNPKDEKVYLDLARIYHKTNLINTKAMTIFLKAYEIDKNFKENTMILVNNLPHGLNKQKKIEICEKALELSDEKWDIYLVLGQLKNELRDFNGSEECYKKAIEIAIDLTEHKREEDFINIIEHIPLEPELYNFIAHIFMDKKNFIQALYATQITLFLDPCHKVSLERLKLLKLDNNKLLIESHEKFNDSIIKEKEVEFSKLFDWIKPILNQFYTHKIDEEILLNSVLDGNSELYSIIDCCCNILVTEKPKIYVYNGKNEFDIIIDKNQENEPFIIINNNFINNLSLPEKRFILGQKIYYIKRDHIIYNQLSKNLPVLLSDFVIDFIINKIPIPIPKKLKIKNLPVEKLLDSLKSATLPSYFYDWGRKMIKEQNRTYIIENMLKAIDESADRCGFICCCDLSVSTKVLLNYNFNLKINKNLKEILQKNQIIKNRIISLWKYSLSRNFMNVLLS